MKNVLIYVRGNVRSYMRELVWDQFEYNSVQLVYLRIVNNVEVQIRGQIRGAIRMKVVKELELLSASIWKAWANSLTNDLDIGS